VTLPPEAAMGKHRGEGRPGPYMPEKPSTSRLRQFLTCAALLAGVGFGVSASAQMNPVPPGAAGPPPAAGAPVNAICPRLEAQLATIDRGGSNDPAKDEQIRRYQDAAARQQSELDRVRNQAKRQGCDNSGFFSLFNQRSAQCGPINTQIQQMRANLDQINSSLEQLRTDSGFNGERDNQRRSVLIALAQNNCGPQYASAAQQAGAGGPGGFLSNLFGGGTIAPPPGDLGPPSGTYRTVCVRTCDGGYFPVSFATVPARFPDDEKTCKALCPATDAALYAYRNPGEDINQAVSVNGAPYTALPNAFRFRSEFNPSCSCRAPGQTWSDALKSIDEKAAAEQQGDIIVTEESAKKMQQRPSAKPAQASAKKGAQATTGAAPPAESSAPPPERAAAPPTDNKQIRSVGPTFLPNNPTPR
jgi:hypothetical protein